jgi:hypothetical protein
MTRFATPAPPAPAGAGGNRRGRAAARAGLGAAAVIAGTALIAACGSSGGSSPSGGGKQTVTVTASSSPHASTPSPSPSGAGSSTPAGPPGCATSALQVTTGPGNGAAGSTIVPLVFDNISGSTCSLYGYPGVSFVTGQGGSQIGLPASEDAAQPRTQVTLAPGDKASAQLKVTVAQNFPASSCHLVTAHWLKIYPPGQTAPLYLKFTSATCSSTKVRVLAVQTVQPGTGSS